MLMAVHRVDAPQIRGTWLGKLLRALNPLMRLVLRSPFHWPLSRWFLLLTWLGPVSRREHTIPVAYVSQADDLFLTTGDTWWRNVVRSNRVRLRLAGHDRKARAELVPYPDSVRMHQQLFRERPFFRRLAGVPVAGGGEPDEAAIERSIHAGRTLVRLRT